MRTIKISIFLSMLTFFISCNSDNFTEHEIGSNLINKSTDVVLVDTFTIESSTVILDSLVTSGFKTAILGSYKDQFLGDVKAEYYGVLGLNNSFTKPVKKPDDVPVKVSIRFDSLVFMAYPNGQYFGDTLQPQRIIINRVTDDMELPNNEFAFYGHTRFNYEETPLLDAEFFLNPVKQSEYDEKIDTHFQKNEINYYGKYYGEGIYLKMDSEQAISLGKDIVKKVNAESDFVTKNIQWHKYMKGVVIRSGDNNSVMWQAPIGENKLRLRLYYSETNYEDEGIQKFHDFPIIQVGSKETLSFTNYSSDRTTTPQGLDRLIEQKVELDSDETDNLTFIQGGIGLYTKINIPFVENLNALGLTGGVINAELIMYPKDNSFDKELFPLPQTNLLLFNTNDDNEFISVFPGVNNSPLQFSFVQNFENGDESYYSVDLTSYVNNVLRNGKEREDAILIGIQNLTIGNTYDRLIIENKPKSDFRIRLKVTYVIQR